MVVSVEEFVLRTGLSRDHVFAWKRYGLMDDPGPGLVDIEAAAPFIDRINERKERAEVKRQEKVRAALEKKRHTPEWFSQHHMDKILNRRVIDPNTGCWNIPYAINPGGYSQWRSPSRASIQEAFTHRFTYRFLKGPIPDGLHIDHLCRNRACANPDHMEPVTCAVNVLRGEGLCAQNARRSHCSNGHEFTPENTQMVLRSNGKQYRRCATCRKEYLVRDQKRKR